MEKTWRWFGPSDIIPLSDLRQIGVEGIVTALHDVPNGEVWTVEMIRIRQALIEEYGMRWSVVESLPVSESIKYGGLQRDDLIDNYIESLENYLYEANSELNELKWQRDKNICYKIKKWLKLC